MVIYCTYNVSLFLIPIKKIIVLRITNNILVKLNIVSIRLTLALSRCAGLDSSAPATSTPAAYGPVPTGTLADPATEQSYSCFQLFKSNYSYVYDKSDHTTSGPLPAFTEGGSFFHQQSMNAHTKWSGNVQKRHYSI